MRLNSLSPSFSQYSLPCFVAGRAMVLLASTEYGYGRGRNVSPFLVSLVSVLLDFPLIIEFRHVSLKR